MTERHSSRDSGVRASLVSNASTPSALSIETEFPRLPEAACKGIKDPDRFYAFEPRHIEQARNICRRCPAIRECLAWALTHHEEGVWAATTADERADLIARHRRTA